MVENLKKKNQKTLTFYKNSNYKSYESGEQAVDITNHYCTSTTVLSKSYAEKNNYN